MVAADEEAYRERLAELTATYRPANAQQRSYVEGIAFESVMVARCVQRERLCREAESLAARHTWEADRMEEVARLGATRPAPERIALRLQRTLHGCQWLIWNWNCLLTVLDCGGRWTAEDRERALTCPGSPRTCATA